VTAGFQINIDVLWEVFFSVFVGDFVTQAVQVLDLGFGLCDSCLRGDILFGFVDVVLVVFPELRLARPYSAYQSAEELEVVEVFWDGVSFIVEFLF
jgi:hypothetical protein